MTRRQPSDSSVTFETVRKIARALENVEESTSYGTPAFKVRGALFVRLWRSVRLYGGGEVANRKPVPHASWGRRGRATESACPCRGVPARPFAWRNQAPGPPGRTVALIG